MRDVKRIPEVLAAIGELWMANPDLRLGQIMSNANVHFYTEDDKALQGLNQWIDYYKDRKVRP